MIRFAVRMSNCVFHRKEVQLLNRNTEWGRFGCLEVRSSEREAPKRSLVFLSDIYGHQTDSTFLQTQRILQTGVVDSILVPDLFLANPYPQDQLPIDPTLFEDWRNKYAVPYERIIDIVLTVTEHLIENGVQSVGLVGYCYGGGRLTEVLSQRDLPKELKTAVAFYGTRIDAENVGKLKVPVLMIFGEHDYLVPPQIVQDIRQKMNLLPEELKGKIEVFPNRGHGFVHNGSKDDQEDSDKAMEMAIDWLRMYI